MIGGLDVAEHSLETRRRVGYLPENMVLYPDLSVDALLEFGARVREIDPKTTRDRIEYSLKICGLKDVRRKLIGKLSKGYRQRVGIAQAILSDPEVLILDEPTVGLDPRQVVEIRELIRSLAGHSTVLLSTHILPEVTMTCRRIVIIDKGASWRRTRRKNSPRNCKATSRASSPWRVRRRSGARDAARRRGVQRVEERPATRRKTASAAFVAFSSGEGDQIRWRDGGSVVQHGWGLLEIKPVALSLEDLFHAHRHQRTAPRCERANSSTVLR